MSHGHVETYPKFKPGDGGTPPYLAGRTPEQQVLRDALKSLREGEGASRNVILSGPRGNGKTVLMRWLENECRHDNVLDAVWLTPASIGNNLDELATRCAPPKKWGRLPDEIESGIEIVKLKWRLDNAPGSLADMLVARCRQRPLVLLLDEAHTLNQELGFTLLNVSQEVRAKAPFLLVLGGTPGLEQRLNDMDTSFWTRAKKLAIGLLDEDGARAALVEPFRQHGISFQGDALARIIADSQCYPYFLQCWGKVLTDCLTAKEQAAGQRLSVNPALVDEVQAEVDTERIGHYEPLRRRIDQAGLQSLAAGIAEAYANTDRLHETHLKKAIRTYLRHVSQPNDDMAIHTCMDQLADFGYVWRPPASNAVWHAGIPSLMRHVLDTERYEG